MSQIRNTALKLTSFLWRRVCRLDLEYYRFPSVIIFSQRHQVEMFEKKGSKSGFMKSLAQTISAMLNTLGGTIYFGNIHYFEKGWH